MSWRIFSLIFILPFHFAFASPEDFTNGVVWVHLLNQGQTGAAEDMASKIRDPKNFELVSKAGAPQAKGPFLEIVKGPNRTVFLGMSEDGVRIFMGGSASSTIAAQIVKRAIESFKNGQGIDAATYDGKGRYEKMGAYSVVSMKLNPHLTIEQLLQVIHSISSEGKSCNYDMIPDWTSR